MSAFTDFSTKQASEIIPGFFGKFVHTENLTVAYWQVKAESELPSHSHHHEQITMLESGEFEMTVDGLTQRVVIGSPVVIAPHVVHSGKAITDCVIRDVFSPARPEYQ